jgi:uncharacterized membrane-anchored protein
MTGTRARYAALALALAAPRLSPRLVGEEYRLLVRPVDPIDPFRGAYVDLAYEGFERRSGADEVWVPLRRQDGAWEGAGALPSRPKRGPYVACRSDGPRLSCGIESLFVSQSEARRLESALARGGGVARVRIDGSGRAALLAVEPLRPSE